MQMSCKPTKQTHRLAKATLFGQNMCGKVVKWSNVSKKKTGEIFPLPHLKKKRNSMEIHLQGYSDPPKRNNQIIQALILWQLSSLPVRWSKIRSLETPSHPAGRSPTSTTTSTSSCKVFMSSTLNKTSGFLEGVSVKPPKKELLGRDVSNCPVKWLGFAFWLLDLSCVMLLQVDLLYILYQIYVMSVLWAHFTSYLHEIIQSLWRWRSPEVTYDLDHLAGD